jgi:hypothetical protein
MCRDSGQRNSDLWSSAPSLSCSIRPFYSLYSIGSTIANHLLCSPDQIDLVFKEQRIRFVITPPDSQVCAQPVMVCLSDDMTAHTVSGVAFVTGGARGLGNAVAVSFAREGCHAVAIVDILPDAEFAKGKEEVEKHGAKVGVQ